MSKLDVLLKIISGVIPDFKLPENINENSVDIELSAVKVDKSVTINGNVIIVNADTPEGKLIAERIFVESENLTKPGQRAIETGMRELISGAKDTVAHGQADISAYRPYVPQKDLPIVSDALFIRQLHARGVDVSRYKELLRLQYGARGNNISNLLSAGYYEDYLKPFHDFLKVEEGDPAEAIYQEIYEEAVMQYPFAVFVSQTKTHREIKDEITRKISLNLLSDQHMLNIHGIGSGNIKKIRLLLSDEDITKFFASDPDIVHVRNTIFVRIYF